MFKTEISNVQLITLKTNTEILEPLSDNIYTIDIKTNEYNDKTTRLIFWTKSNTLDFAIDLTPQLLDEFHSALLKQLKFIENLEV